MLNTFFPVLCANYVAINSVVSAVGVLLEDSEKVSCTVSSHGSVQTKDREHEDKIIDVSTNPLFENHKRGNRSHEVLYDEMVQSFNYCLTV